MSLWNPHRRGRFHTPREGRLLRFGDFHDREWFYVLGRIKVFAIMENPGVLHDREDFCPISGGKIFRDHGASRGCGTGARQRAARLGMNHGKHPHDAAVPAARSTAGTRVVSKCCLAPVAVHDNGCRSGNGLRGLFVYRQAVKRGAINCPLPRARRHPEPTFDFLCRQLSSAAMHSTASGRGPGRWRRSRPSGREGRAVAAPATRARHGSSRRWSRRGCGPRRSPGRRHGKPVSPRRTAEPGATSLGSGGLQIRLRIIIILSETSCLPYV
jgi:hypothetical protein